MMYYYRQGHPYRHPKEGRFLLKGHVIAGLPIQSVEHCYIGVYYNDFIIDTLGEDKTVRSFSTIGNYMLKKSGQKRFAFPLVSLISIDSYSKTELIQYFNCNGIHYDTLPYLENLADDFPDHKFFSVLQYYKDYKTIDTLILYFESSHDNDCLLVQLNNEIYGKNPLIYPVYSPSYPKTTSSLYINDGNVIIKSYNTTEKISFYTWTNLYLYDGEKLQKYLGFTENYIKNKKVTITTDAQGDSMPLYVIIEYTPAPEQIVAFIMECNHQDTAQKIYNLLLQYLYSIETWTVKAFSLMKEFTENSVEYGKTFFYNNCLQHIQQKEITKISYCFIKKIEIYTNEGLVNYLKTNYYANLQHITLPKLHKLTKIRKKNDYLVYDNIVITYKLYDKSEKIFILHLKKDWQANAVKKQIEEHLTGISFMPTGYRTEDVYYDW